MRIHPVIYGPFLEPADNDVIPLAKPIRTLDGRTVTEIPVGKGQLIHASIAGYNRYVFCGDGQSAIVLMIERID